MIDWLISNTKRIDLLHYKLVSSNYCSKKFGLSPSRRKHFFISLHFMLWSKKKFVFSMMNAHEVLWHGNRTPKVGHKQISLNLNIFFFQMFNINSDPTLTIRKLFVLLCFVNGFRHILIFHPIWLSIIIFFKMVSFFLVIQSIEMFNMCTYDYHEITTSIHLYFGKLEENLVLKWYQKGNRKCPKKSNKWKNMLIL